MLERKSLTKVFVEKYRYASKREKMDILDEFVDYTRFRRNYAARLLRIGGSPEPNEPRHRKHAVFYDSDVISSLKKLWEVSDFICGKRLVAIIPELIRKGKQFHEFDISKNVELKLKTISASTIDRNLASDKTTLGRKGSSMTKGTRYLIDRIPIKTFTEWNNSPAGFTQMDLVAHNGGNVYGGFLYTLDVTDIHTSWTVLSLLMDKSDQEMVKALDFTIDYFPFPITGIHSDNGSEFINDTVLSYSKTKGLIFTRGRPYKKNDNPHVEQKNNSILRRNTGYLRYDKPEHAAILRELYGYLNLYVNYFQPTMILREKHRIGAKAIRKYDSPKTPYQRVLESATVSEEVKIRIRTLYEALNPADLKRKINDCQARLIRVAAPIRVPLEPVKIRRKKQMKHTIPVWRREMSSSNKNPFLSRQRLEELRRATEKVLLPRKIAKKGLMSLHDPSS